MERNVVIDHHSGFCFGVVYAIQMAEDFLSEYGTLFCLGDIVHNDKEVERLHSKGLKIITHDDLHNLHDTHVLIRAHGEPPSTYEIALKNNITLIDASCPVVLKLQHRVRESYDHEKQIIIYGKPGHAEVNGLVGQTKGSAIVVTSEGDVENLCLDRPVAFFSQTTKSTKNFYQLADLLKLKGEVAVNDTICRQVSNREPDLKRFSAQHDLILFVSGLKSSNGKVLYEACKSVNPETYFITGPEDIQLSWLAGKGSVGVCGATSTPMWLMEEVASRVQNL